MRIVVVTSTYNERQNVGRFIDELEEVFERLDHHMRILIVDDSSPDGTAEAVRQRMASKPNVDLLTGPKRGLGVAYIRGLRYALDELGADAVVQMHFLAAEAVGILPALFWNYFLGERVLQLLWASPRVWLSGLRKAWSRLNGWA